MTPIILSFIGALWINEDPIPWNESNGFEEPPITLRIPGTRPVIHVEGGNCIILLFKFTDEEWSILTNTFREHVQIHDTTYSYSFGSTNAWSRAHAIKD